MHKLNNMQKLELNCELKKARGKILKNHRQLEESLWGLSFMWGVALPHQ